MQFRLVHYKSDTYLRASMKNPLVCAILCLMVLCEALGQSDLSHRIDSLNNAFEYQTSVQLLNEQLKKASNTNADRLEALFSLSDTYKRLRDYRTAASYLHQALEVSHSEEDSNRALARISFIHFDTQEYDEAKAIQDDIALSGFRGLNNQEQGYLILQEGYIDFLKEDYESALRSCALAKQKIAPCDMPVVLSKEMGIYSRLNKMDSVDNIYRRANIRAKQCKIAKYQYLLARSYYDLMTEHQNFEGMAIYSKKMDSINEVLDDINNISQLSFIEKVALNDSTKKLKSRTSKLTIILSFLSLLALGLAWYLINLFRKNKKLAAEMNVIQQQMASYLEASKPENKDELNNLIAEELFTDRQIEIIERMALQKSNKDIAEELHISVNTVKYHIKNIYKIMQEHDIEFER